jgi:hypothetical protein
VNICAFPAFQQDRCARVGFIVTNLSRPPERVVAFYNKRGTCEQWIKSGVETVPISPYRY